MVFVVEDRSLRTEPQFRLLTELGCSVDFVITSPLVSVVWSGMLGRFPQHGFKQE